MGYHTDFCGQFDVTPPLKPEHRGYLFKFSETRRMKRDPVIAETLPDPIRQAAGLPIGDEGAYFVGRIGCLGQDSDESVLSLNDPPGQPRMASGEDYMQWRLKANEAVAEGNAQPGLWCQWVPNEEGTAIEWDQGEKFYEYVEWIEYLIHNFLQPWGYTLNGEVAWEGDDSGDIGTIFVKDNQVEAVASEVVNAGPSWARNDN